MAIWHMNLKDNRKEGKCSDEELKFRLCKEKGILAIGWNVTAEVNSWQEYRLKAEKVYTSEKKNLTTACNGFEKMKEGDLVWVANPVTKDWYLTRVIDKNSEPTICKNLKEFDICSYRICEFLNVTISDEIIALLNSDKISKRLTLSEIHNEKMITATNALVNVKEGK